MSDEEANRFRVNQTTKKDFFADERRDVERYYTSALVTTKSAVAKTTMCKPRKNSRSHAKPYTLTRSG